MPWWFAFIFASLFFGTLAVISSKYMQTNMDFFRLNLYFLPIIYLLNVWYSKTFHATYEMKIPLFAVSMVAVSIEAIVSFLLGYLFLNQTITLFQLLGGLLIIGGIFLLKF